MCVQPCAQVWLRHAMRPVAKTVRYARELAEAYLPRALHPRVVRRERSKGMTGFPSPLMLILPDDLYTS